MNGRGMVAGSIPVNVPIPVQSQQPQQQNMRGVMYNRQGTAAAAAMQGRGMPRMQPRMMPVPPEQDPQLRRVQQQQMQQQQQQQAAVTDLAQCRAQVEKLTKEFMLYLQEMFVFKKYIEGLSLLFMHLCLLLLNCFFLNHCIETV